MGIGEQRYLVRFYDFRRDTPDRIVTRRPSRAGAAGEAAFWETLGDWSPDTERPLALLRKAVRQRPSDGRSQFYLGALHVYLAAESPPTSPSGLGIYARRRSRSIVPSISCHTIPSRRRSAHSPTT